MKRNAVFVVLLASLVFLSPAQGFSDGSYVIGRITGTQKPLPGFFENNSRLMARGTDRVEFTGFRLVREDDNRKYLIRPNHEGFFYQALPGGTYSLTRKRTDRPDYRQPENIDILRFEVQPGTLVNMGTIDILFEGEPEESLRLYQKGARGTYIYTYHYERDSSDISHSSPLQWFKAKKPGIVSGYEESTVREDAALTSGQDGSRVYIQEFHRFDDD